MEDVTYFKLGSLVGLLIISLVASLIPLKIASDSPERSERILAFLSFFTGGVFLGAGLLHMLPDAINEQRDAGLFTTFPVALLTAALGFVAIWGLEKVHFGADIENAPLDREHMVAVTARAYQKSANICYVTVQPTTTYGSLSKTLEVSTIPQRSVSSPALRLLASPHGLAGRSAVSPIVVALDQLPQEVQETLSPRARPGTPPTGSTSSSSRSKRRGSSASMAGSGEESDESDTGLALSSYQAARSPSPHKPKLILSALNDEHGNGELGNGALDSRPSRSNGKSLRAQAHANLQQHKQRGKGHAHAVSDVCESPNKGLHEHVCYEEHHSVQLQREHARSPVRTPKNSIISIPSDDTGSQPLLIKRHEDLDTPRSAYSSDSGDDADHMHDHSHQNVHHHHIVIPGNIFLPLALTAVFSLHSVIEGAALGIQSKLSSGALSILIAITSHKAIEAVTVSSNFVKEKVEFRTAVPIILLYCAMTPTGILLGLLADDFVGSDHTVLVTTEMSAFAAGSFVYLAIHEISDEKCCSRVAGKWQVVLMLTGLLTMATLAFWV